MSDAELLNQAERLMQPSHQGSERSPEFRQEATQLSIAKSLLVIARNSMPGVEIKISDDDRKHYNTPIVPMPE